MASSFLKELVAKVEEAIKALDGAARREAEALVAQLKAELAAVEADVKNAETDLKTEIGTLVAEYAPEAAALEGELVRAVEAFVQGILGRFTGN